MNPNNDHKQPSIRIVFDNNLSAAFLYKKAEKLTSAIYLVSSFIKDEDRLKWQLRSKGLDLLSLTISASHIDLSDKKQTQKIAAHLIELISLFEIAFVSKIFSEMNFSILKQEMLSLLSLLEHDPSAEASTAYVLSNDFFNVDKEAVSSQTDEVQTIPSKMFGSVNSNAAEHGKVSKGQAEKSVVSFKNSSKEQVLKNKVQSVRLSQNDRKTIILDLIRTKKEIGVTDLGDLIKGCSEKTIQRELLSMVKEGVLKKQGERRWSRYMRA